MSAEAKQPLLAQIDEAQGHLDGLQQNLRDVDGELASFATQREQYRLLEGICAALQTLTELGGADAFWGDRVAADGREEHLRGVRARVSEFASQLRVAEDKRQGILDRISEGGNVLAILEGDLLDVEHEELERSYEWVVERELGPVPDGPQLPWARGGEEDQRLRKALGACLLVGLLAAALLPLVNIPLPDVTQAEKVPERIVKFIE